MQYPEIYCALHQGTVGDIEFYIKQCHRLQSICKDRDLRILELGCGAGRLTLALVQAGFQVVGLDQSSSLLKMARRQAESLQLSNAQVRWIHGDMCQLDQVFTSQEYFDVILITYNTLYCLPNEVQQIKCLHQVSSFLHPQGLIMCDGYQLPDPDEYLYETADDFEVLTVLSYLPGSWPFSDSIDSIEIEDLNDEAILDRIDINKISLMSLSEEESEKAGVIHVGIEEKDEYQQDQQRCRIDYRYRWDTGDIATANIEHRYLYVHQLPLIFQQAQLKVLDIYDHFTTNTADIESQHWCVIARLADLNIEDFISIK
jgi:SAM-dependent methyltransferase